MTVNEVSKKERKVIFQRVFCQKVFWRNRSKVYDRNRRLVDLIFAAFAWCLAYHSNLALAQEDSLRIKDDWLVLGLSAQQFKNYKHMWQCDGELSPIIEKAKAPLTSLNWIHSSGCVRDWISTSTWSRTKTLQLLIQLESLGFRRFPSAGHKRKKIELPDRFGLSLSRTSDFFFTHVWILCSGATCQIFASESRRSITELGAASP